MSCRHKYDSPPTLQAFDAPCSSRKWRRRRQGPATACNDNAGRFQIGPVPAILVACSALLGMAACFAAWIA